MIGVRAVAARSTNRSDNDSGSGSGSSEDGGEEAALQELQERRDDVSARCRRAPPCDSLSLLRAKEGATGEEGAGGRGACAPVAQEQPGI